MYRITLADCCEPVRICRFGLTYLYTKLYYEKHTVALGTGVDAGSRMVGTAIEFISWKSVLEVSDSPLTKSTSPSDFWGRRWNALVHIVLKGGVYIPLRKNGFSKGIAALATFVASGLLHEYVLTALAFKGVLLDDHSAYTPRYGYHLAFFVWNGLNLILEGIFYKHPIIQWMKRTLPKPVIVVMVLMTVLPIGHWFTGKSHLACFGSRRGTLSLKPLTSSGMFLLLDQMSMQRLGSTMIWLWACLYLCGSQQQVQRCSTPTCRRQQALVKSNCQNAHGMKQ